MNENKKQEIITNLNQYKLEIIEVLIAGNGGHFNKYFKIKSKFIKNDFDEQFKKVFCNFYRLNGPGGLNTSQKNKFFELLFLKENDLKNNLKILHEIPGYKNSHKLFLSFVTKLQHTINDKLPIYDKNIASILELQSPTYPTSLEERIKNRMDIYQELKNNFAILLADEQIKNYLKNIRQELQHKATLCKFNWFDEFISDTKLLDSSL
ncbi:MAG: hypothetical protein LRZ92_00565, partial [Methanosarcinaceae archaeon]|nr:hypothetical protein [Methanosarcinaceae archaeon]